MASEQPPLTSQDLEHCLSVLKRLTESPASGDPFRNEIEMLLEAAGRFSRPQVAFSGIGILLFYRIITSAENL